MSSGSRDLLLKGAEEWVLLIEVFVGHYTEVSWVFRFIEEVSGCSTDQMMLLDNTRPIE